MEMRYEAEVPLTPRAVFEALRAYRRLYPRLHPAHEPVAEPERLLTAGDAFAAAERFGLERRRYAFRVALYDPETPRLALEARVVTCLAGVPILRSGLRLDFRFTPLPDGGTRVLATQHVSLGPTWLERLLLAGRAGEALRRHALAESEAARDLLLAEGGFSEDFVKSPARFETVGR